ncbi:DUF805 domain-containing protein [Phenylobacterium sp.]|jgi:uncharacterized membrane protein YhaH (DUF805 family)|uniref:DUF805 domain-containing protein n=1 Tax=Phenylobacterium sp. TaxID=1871053 RepID=UPI000C8DFADE|nr:DUF805 domain-containing protein [Phenylobacterium sp.]MAK81635.1 hypothetical protein [Phenylobacterium sp.]|tara:strand:+ start:24390 stop:24773 length:384 start_codon:yes stop_codon:yes gene_type:complete
MIEAVRYGFANYMNFDGRTDRATFWWWVLAVFLAAIAASILDDGLASGGVEPFTLLLTLGLFLPHLGMAIRRLHDTGRSGWWVLIGLIPLIGLLVLIFFYVQPSNPDGEKYDPPGPSPMPPEPPPAG